MASSAHETTAHLKVRFSVAAHFGSGMAAHAAPEPPRRPTDVKPDQPSSKPSSTVLEQEEPGKTSATTPPRSASYPPPRASAGGERNLRSSPRLSFLIARCFACRFEEQFGTWVRDLAGSLRAGTRRTLLCAPDRGSCAATVTITPVASSAPMPSALQPTSLRLNSPPARQISVAEDETPKNRLFWHHANSCVWLVHHDFRPR